MQHSPYRSRHGCLHRRSAWLCKRVAYDAFHLSYTESYGLGGGVGRGRGAWLGLGVTLGLGVDVGVDVGVGVTVAVGDSNMLGVGDAVGVGVRVDVAVAVAVAVGVAVGVGLGVPAGANVHPVGGPPEPSQKYWRKHMLSLCTPAVADRLPLVTVP